VDLVFCHRFLRHIKQLDLRTRIFAELARVSRRYVIVSYYEAGFRSRIKWQLKNLVGLAGRDSKPVTMEQFLHEAEGAGLQLVAEQTLRKIPRGMFCLFEKGTSSGTAPATAGTLSNDPG